MPKPPLAEPERAYEEARHRIFRALSEAATTLDLGGMGLSEIPPEIGRMTRLRVLDLRGNLLTRLPESLSLLTALETLLLGDNPLLPPYRFTPGNDGPGALRNFLASLRGTGRDSQNLRAPKPWPKPGPRPPLPEPDPETE